MHQLYLEAYEPECGQVCCQRVAVHLQECNRSFGYPRSDTCKFCDELKIAIEKSSNLQLELAEHHFEVCEGYQAPEKTKNFQKQTLMFK